MVTVNQLIVSGINNRNTLFRYYRSIVIGARGIREVTAFLPVFFSFFYALLCFPFLSFLSFLSLFLSFFFSEQERKSMSRGAGGGTEIPWPWDSDLSWNPVLEAQLTESLGAPLPIFWARGLSASSSHMVTVGLQRQLVFHSLTPHVRQDRQFLPECFFCRGGKLFQKAPPAGFPLHFTPCMFWNH